MYLDGTNSSFHLKKQAQENPNKTLFEAKSIFPKQYVGVTSDLRVVISDSLEATTKYIKNEEGVKEL